MGANVNGACTQKEHIAVEIATKTNVRTTQAARTSLPQALKVSFGGGTVMGLGVAGLAVLGLTMFFIFFYNFTIDSRDIVKAFNIGNGAHLG